MLLLVYGDDAFRVHARARELVGQFVRKYDPARMNVDEFVLEKKSDGQLGRVADALGAMPFLSERRFVRIDGMFSSVTTKPDAEPWAVILEKIPASTIVMLVDVISVEKAAKVEIVKRARGVVGVLEYPYPLLTGAGLRTWMIERARIHSAVLVPAVADALVARAGGDTWRLETEIAKLAAYAGGAPITKEMIDALVSGEFSEDIFGLIDAVSGGRPSFALQKLREERSAGADAFPLFGMLVRQIRLLLQVSALLDERPRVGKQDIADTFGIHPFVAQKLMSSAQRASLSQIREWHALAGRLDGEMKRGLSADVAVDRLVAVLLDTAP